MGGRLPASPIKGQDARFRHAASKHALSNGPRRANQSTTHQICVLFCLIALAACAYLVAFRSLLSPLDFGSSLSRDSSLCSVILASVSAKGSSWAMISPSLVSLAIAGLTHVELSVATTNQSPATGSSSTNTSFRESTAAPGRTTYSKWTVSAVNALQTWYDEKDGLWLTTGWWNAANCLTVLADLYAVDVEEARSLGLDAVFTNTFTQAPRNATTVQKKFITSHDGLRMVESNYQPKPELSGTDLAERGFSGFINDFYDDEGWWALAWIRAYDVTGNTDYLSTAETIFHDMQGGLVNATCGGGIWWDKARTYKNAIANELFLSVAASLANRASNANDYMVIAQGQWAWFQRSGMINKKNLVNDGLAINADGTCANNEENTWSYNQGVILGGLVELYKATANSTLLAQAVDIAEAAITALSVGGILHDSCENDCGADGSQFKGIFMRNLQCLQLQVNSTNLQTFIVNNANSIWAHDRNSSDYLGLNWAGPPSAGGNVTAATQSSALDALVAALAVS